MIINRITTAGVLIAAATVAGAPAEAQQRPQTRPMSINEWLQAERNNANMQRAVEEYERARYGTATPQQAYRPQPAYQPPSYGQPPQPTYRTYAPEQAQAPTGAPQAAPAQPVAPQPLTPNEPPGYHQPRYPQQQVQPQSPPYPYQAQPGGQLPQYSNQQNTYQVPPNALEKIDKEYRGNGASTGAMDSGFFIGGNIGWSPYVVTTFTTGSTTSEPEMSLLAYQVSGNVGYKMDNGVSFDLAALYNYADIDSRDGYTSVLAVIPSAKYEFDVNTRLKPYITGGIGPGILTAEDITSSYPDNSDSGFIMAAQIGAGLMMPLSDKTSLDFGYKILGTSDAELDLNGRAFTGSFVSHSLLFGFRHQL